MSTAAYGIEAIWEGQQWLLDGFNKLAVAIGRAVAGTFSSRARTPYEQQTSLPTRPALDRRRERLLASALAAPAGTPKRGGDRGTCRSFSVHLPDHGEGAHPLAGS